MILAGVEVLRHGLSDLLQQIIDASGFLYTTTSLGGLAVHRVRNGSRFGRPARQRETSLDRRRGRRLHTAWRLLGGKTTGEKNKSKQLAEGDTLELHDWGKYDFSKEPIIDNKEYPFIC